ncbi:hypothetical protein ACFU7Y_18565 [Kitasatospora sp. NPDC057542]|uniref:hypothetical protein n=1 Tax=Kitasatospora sp. NPDC057542 TaxID=3346162 RepID=UPI0036A35269
MRDVSVLPVATEPPAEDGDQEQRERQHAVNEVFAEAGEAGRRAAGWVCGLAARQLQPGHHTVLERAADAVEQAAGREIVPGGESQLAEELAYDLAADVITGSILVDGLPELSTGERIALIAVCALAAALPGTVLNDPTRELPVLTATMNAATQAGIAADPR